MVTYVVDASAVIRYLDGEEGATRMKTVLRDRREGRARLLISSVHWGEIAGVLFKREGTSSMQDSLAGLERTGFEIISASSDHAVRSALLKRRHNLPYADSFGVALAMELDAIFITADYDFKAVDHLINIEFIDAKA